MSALREMIAPENPASLSALPTRELSVSGLASPQSPSSLRNLNPLSSKVATVLSTSYADSEFRDALQLLDDRGVKNTAELRRQLRLDLQKEVIDSNGEIVFQFGRVADVSFVDTSNPCHNNTDVLA